jgi:hypothetical protein
MLEWRAGSEELIENLRAFVALCEKQGLDVGERRSEGGDDWDGWRMETTPG